MPPGVGDKMVPNIRVVSVGDIAGEPIRGFTSDTKCSCLPCLEALRHDVEGGVASRFLLR